MMAFKPGDTVRLISGSPVMTVTAVIPETFSIEVYWVDVIDSNSVILPEVCFKAAQPE